MWRLGAGEGSPASKAEAADALSVSPGVKLPLFWKSGWAGKAYALCDSPYARAVCFNPVNGHMCSS